MIEIDPSLLEPDESVIAPVPRGPVLPPDRLRERRPGSSRVSDDSMEAGWFQEEEPSRAAITSTPAPSRPPPRPHAGTAERPRSMPPPPPPASAPQDPPAPRAAAASRSSPVSLVQSHAAAAAALATMDASSPRASAPRPPATGERRLDPIATFGEPRLDREVAALAAPFPTRAALVQALRARVAADLHGDLALADTRCDEAAGLAPNARFVALTRRWLAVLRGTPSEIVAAARQEIPLAGDAAERVALLWQIATLEPDPEPTLWLIVELEPHDLGAWLALAASAMQRGGWADAVEAWEAIAARTDDVVARGAFLASAGGIRAAQLGDDDGAQLAFERALEADPASAAAHGGREHASLVSGAIAEHARLAAIEARRVGDLEPALGYHERAGDLLSEGARDSNAAAGCYERAAAVARTDVAPLGKLAALHEHAGRYPELVAAYQALLPRIQDPSRRGAVLLRLGMVLESRLDRADDAIACYRAALDAMPTLAPAAQALARLYQAQRRWDDAAAVLLVEVDRLDAAGLRAGRYLAIAELLEAHGGSGPQVVALYERALALDPSQTAALDALDRSYRATGHWDELIALHEAQLAHTTHPSRARALRLMLAALYLDRAGEPDTAVDRLRAALAGPPDHLFTLAVLSRALAEAGKWTEHVAVLEAQAASLGDGPELVATLYRIATVVENRLADPARALASYERVLAHQPRHELALQAILRLHGSQAQWEDVIASERRLLELAERPEEATVILHRIAHVCEDKLARPEDAIAAYEEALRQLPDYRPARVALARLLRACGRFDRLAQLLEEQAASATVAGDRARLLGQAGLVRELHAQDGTAAAKLYADGLALDPELPMALWGLCRIQVQVADWVGAAETLGLVAQRARHGKSRARLLIQEARLHELRLANADRAAELYEQAVAADPGEPAIVLERLRVALAGAGPGGDAPRWLDEAARSTTDPHLASGMRRLQAALLERAGQRAEAREAYAIALQHDTSPEVVEGLARTSTGAALAEALSFRAPQLKDPPTRALLHALAGVLHDRSDAAEIAYRAALAVQPELLPALEGRRALAEAAGDARGVATLLAQQAAISVDPRTKVELLEQAAATFERLGDTDAALGRYRDVLAVEPGRVTALGRALELLEHAGEYGRAATLIAEQAGSVADRAARAELLACRARILSQHLGDSDGAVADVERAVELLPNNPALLALLARLHEALRHWADAAHAYDQLVQCGDAEDRRTAALGQARIWTTEVPDHARAQRILEAAAQRDPTDRVIEAKLAAAAELAGDVRRAGELYRGLATRGSASDRVAAMLAYVELRRGALDPGEPDPVAPAFALALEDPSVIPSLEAHYRGDLAAYITHAAAALSYVTRGDVVPLQVSLGRAYGREPAPPERAIPYLRSACASDPDSTPLRIALAAAYAGRDDRAAIAELRRVVASEPTEALVYQRIAEACTRSRMEVAAGFASTAAALLGDDDRLARGLGAPALPPPISGSLPPDDALAILVGPTRAPDVRRLVAQLDPYLHEIFPEDQHELAELAPLPETAVIGEVIRGIARALAVATLPVSRRERGLPTLLASEPRSFVVPRDQVGDDAIPSVRFHAGYAIARLAGGSLLGHAVALEQVEGLMLAVVDPDRDEHGLRKRVAQAMPRRARKELERLVAELGVIDAAACTTWENEERQRALGAGVIMCGDLRAVARSICPEAFAAATPAERRARVRASPLMLEALRFAVGDGCWTASHRVYGRR